MNPRCQRAVVAGAIQPAESIREGLLLRQDYYTPEVVMRISEKQLCVGLKPEFIAAECASCSKIGDRILQIRGKCVMVDRDLAELYKVPTKVLNQAVKRNVERFPERFRFALTPPEKEEVVTNCDHLKSLRFSHVPVYAFTEQGVAISSSSTMPSCMALARPSTASAVALLPTLPVTRRRSTSCWQLFGKSE